MCILACQGHDECFLELTQLLYPVQLLDVVVLCHYDTRLCVNVESGN